MTKDEIRLMARDAGIIGPINKQVMDFAHACYEAGRTAEREECAKVCDTTPPHPFRPSIEAAHAIRARGKP